MKQGQARFSMVKERHARSLQQAISDGKADEAFVPFCQWVSKTGDFFTSSSCSGRIALVQTDSKNSKKEASFLARWHEPADWAQLARALEKESLEEEVWFKQEPFILHIGTNNLENANRILDACKSAGLKRAGIMLAKEGKFMVELMGTQSMSLPIQLNKKRIVSEELLKSLLNKANQKMTLNRQQFERFEKAFKKFV